MRKTASVVLGVILFGTGAFVTDSVIGSGVDELPSHYNQNLNNSIIHQNYRFGNVTLLAQSENVPAPASSPLPVIDGSEQSQRAKKLSEIAGLDSDNSSAVQPGSTVVPAESPTMTAPQPETGQPVNPQDAAVNLSYLGQIKVVSLGKTALGEPTVLVRWFRPQELGITTESSSVTVRIERAPSPDGPWMTITDPLAESQAGYWWKATMLDAKPFYLRIIRSEQGRETISALSQLIDLSTRLAGLPLETGPTAPVTPGNVAQTVAGQPAYQPPVASTIPTPGQTPIPAWLNASQGTNPPAPVASANVTSNPPDGQSTASPSPTDESSEAGSHLPEAVAKNTSFSTTQESNFGNTARHNPTSYNNPNSPIVRGNAPAPAGTGRTNPGVMTLNPIFTEGFNVFFPASRGRSQESTVPVSMNPETGQLAPSASADTPSVKKRSIFTPPHRNVVPPQTYPNEQARRPAGYGNAMSNPYMGAYPPDSGYPGNNYNGQPNPMTFNGMGEGNGMNGMPGGNPPGAMGGPSGTGEIIYLDQNGNTIPNPYTGGANQFGVPVGDGTFYQQQPGQ